MSKKIYHDTKMKKHLRDNAVKRNSGMLNTKVANDVRNNNALKYRFSDDSFAKGVEWFNSGLPIEEAPLELRNDGSFIKGFQRGKTIKLVNDTLYDTGKEYYLKGFLLDDIPDNYKNNEFFLNGYNDAINNRRQR